MKEYICAETQVKNYAGATTGTTLWKGKELVRCKDCKHRPHREKERDTGFALDFPDYKCPCQCSDGWYSWYPSDDWFCANGERKNNE